MILYIVRHAVAFDRDAARWPDDRERPLTKKGEKRFKAVAEAMELPKVAVAGDASVAPTVATPR